MGLNNKLIEAVTQGDEIKVNKFLVLGADANTVIDTASNCIPVLTYASKNDEIEIVKLLLEAGADINAEDGAALEKASYFGLIEIVKLLLDAGADVYAGDHCALHSAEWEGHGEIVKLLLEKGNIYIFCKNYYSRQLLKKYLPNHHMEIKLWEALHPLM